MREELARALGEANSEDHALHAVVRDALLEAGDLRAELVALQCPGFPSVDPGAANAFVVRNERALLGPFHLKAFRFGFRCGGLHELVIPAAHFVEGARGLLATAPYPALLASLRWLTPTNGAGLPLDDHARALVDVLAEPAVRIDGLAFDAPLPTRLASALAALPAAARRIHRLAFSRTEPQNFATLLTGRFDALATLALTDAHLDDARLAMLATAPRLEQLERLDLSSARRDARGFRDANPDANTFTAAGLAPWVPRLRALRRLELTRAAYVDDAIFDVLAPRAAQLTHLGLCGTAVTIGGLANGLPAFSSLRGLDLQGIAIDNRVLAPILAMPHLTALGLEVMQLTPKSRRRLRGHCTARGIRLREETERYPQFDPLHD